MEEITSLANANVKRLVLLGQKGKERQRSRSFLIEGERLVLDTPAEFLQEIYVTRSMLKKQEAVLMQLADLLPVIILSGEAMQKAAGTKTPQGILAVAKMPGWKEEDLFSAAGAPLFLILEDIQDPGNLGTMFRTAEAAGAGGLILSEGTADVFAPKTVRATMSAVFRVPFVVVKDLPAAVQSLQKRTIRVYAAHLDESTSYTMADYRGPSAFLIGNEARGLSDRAVQAAYQKIHIPMQGSIESLNAAMSAGILLYEAVRQRSLHI